MRFIKNLGFLFKYSWDISKRSFIATILEIIMDSSEPFIYLIFPTFIINELTGDRNWNTVLLYICFFIGCIALLRSLRIIFTVFINMSVNRCDVKNAMFYAKHFLMMSYEKLEDEKIRNMQQTVSFKVYVNNFILLIKEFFTSLLKLIGFSYIITMLNPIVLIFILGIIIINYFLNKMRSKISYKYQPTIAKYTRIFDYLFATMTNFDYAKEIRVNNVKEMLSNKFNNTVLNFKTDNGKYLVKQFIINLISGIISLIQMLVSYGYVAYNAIINTITVGEFNLYIGAIYNLSGAFKLTLLQNV